VSAPEHALAVAVDDVEPRSFARVRSIRGWLLDRGVSRVTLLVIPATDLHPIGARAPALAAWLRSQVACGDADLRGIRMRANGDVRCRALCLGSSTAVKRALSPALIRAAGRDPGPVMRIDIHPADFDLPGHVATLESLLGRAGGRVAVTYDELLG
jgi:hypothetical protein